MKIFKNISLALAVVMGTSLHAMPEKSDAYKAAAEAWLNSDEQSSLATLSELARSGDVHAQVLLGQIDRDTVAGGSSDYILGLTRQQRRELLRNPKGVGKSRNWLLSLSDDSLDDLGEALFKYRAQLDPIAALVDLNKTGEQDAAQFLVWTTMDEGRFDRANTIPTDQSNLFENGTIHWLRGFMGSENKLMNSSRFLADTSPDKVRGLLALDKLSWVLGLRNSLSTEVRDLILVIRGQPGRVSEDANPLALNAMLKEVATYDRSLGLLNRVCSACPEAEGDPYCMSQSLDIFGGYRRLSLVRTPAEVAVSSEDFFASERSAQIVRNVLQHSSARYAPKIESVCLQSIIAGN